MATNPYVNKVIYGNDTVMDISDTTAEESDVENGKVFYKASGARSVGTGSASGGVSEDLLKDTVGWVGKNLADTTKTEIGTAWNGNANADRARLIVPCESSTEYIISISGTNSLSYIGCKSSASIPPSGIDDITSLLPYTLTTGASDKYITLGFNKTSIAQSDIDALKLMVRRSSIADTTYEPYHETVDACKYNRSEANVLGAKNLIKYPYRGSGATTSGVTYTVNADGTVSLNGTATSGYTEFLIFQRTDYPLTLKKGRYILTGGISNDARITIGHTVNNAWAEIGTDVGNGLEFELPNDDEHIGITLTTNKNGLNTSGMVFKPMIRLASDPDDTYVPYAMTNKELTDSVGNSYTTSDSAETDLADADYVPFYDSSASAKKKSLWSNIKSKLKTYFDGYYFSRTNSLYTTISESDDIPFASNLSPYTRLIPFPNFKSAVLSLAFDLIKSTVGWLGNNLADISKAELGVGIFGTSDDTKARLAIPVESSKTYYASISGTNAFSNISFTVTNTATPTSGLIESGTFPITLSIGASYTYVVFEFSKSTTVTQSDLTALQFMISEKSLDTYNDYHETVEEALDEWTAAQTISTSDTSKTFTGLNANYAYKPFIQVADGEDELQYNSIVFSGTSCTVSFDSPSAAQCTGNACKIKLRVIK